MGTPGTRSLPWQGRADVTVGTMLEELAAAYPDLPLAVVAQILERAEAKATTLSNGRPTHAWVTLLARDRLDLARERAEAARGRAGLSASKPGL